MKIDDIEKEWAIDSILNDVEVDREISKTLSLHSKYWNILNDERKMYRKFERELPVLKLDLKEYYGGTISPEVLESRKWEPYQKKLLKSSIDMYVDASDEMIELQDRLSMQGAKVKFLEDIVKHINSRQFAIKSLVEIKKLMFGVV